MEDQSQSQQEPTYTIEMQDDLSAKSHKVLHLLYLPLIGQKAALCYEALCALAGKEIYTQQQLCDMVYLNPGTFDQERKKLESFGLLVTYYNKKSKASLLRLKAPLEPDKFFTHVSYSRLFFETCGKERTALVQKILLDHLEMEGFEDISQHLDTSSLEQKWTEKKEQAMQEFIPVQSDLAGFSFDWDLFFRRTERTLPTRVRSPENKLQIAYLASAYGIDEENMRKYCIRALDRDKTKFDFERIREYCIHSQKITPAAKDTYDVSPVAFLKSRQPANAEILPKERQFLNDLYEKKHLSYAVINTLIEYGLQKCEGEFVISYLKTTANNMIRANVDTREKALAYFDTDTKMYKSKKRRKSEPAKLPDWYSDKPEEDDQPDYDSQKELEELFAALDDSK
jgi:replication initiation and membrane attachment protein DnaB